MVFRLYKRDLLLFYLPFTDFTVALDRPSFGTDNNSVITIPEQQGRKTVEDNTLME